jgi:hypothetical protein
MDQELVAWLNSNRNYTTGVNIYHRLGTDADLLKYFINANASKQASEKLFNALRQIYYQLKQHKAPTTGIVKAVVLQPEHIVPITTPANAELVDAIKHQADKLYKEMMNLRARLFALTTIEPEANENDANTVLLREKLVLPLMNLAPDVQEQYHSLNYLIEHGNLPDAEPDQEALPTSPVALERMRVNLMTNIAKLKKKAATPDRIQLLNSHTKKLAAIKHELSKYQ